MKPFTSLDAANIWDLIEDHLGNVYAATGGDEGKLFKITPDGKTILLHSSKDSQFFSLAVTPDGAVYAGAGPTGKILRVAADGKVTTAADNLDSYVWSLAYDPTSKSLYAGTGPKGKIYRLTPAGKTEIFYVTKQEHILCLALGENGTLYAGADKGGLVYRIAPSGKGFVLYHANQPEVRALLVTPNAVFAGTKRLRWARKGSGFGSLGASKGDNLPSTPPPGENSLYRIASDGSVRELYRDKTMILRLGQNHGKLLVATGMQGQLFEIDETTKEKTEIARLDVGQIHCLLQRKDGAIVLGTGDPGKLFLLEDRFAAKGTVLSEVLDTKIQSKWGAMTWKTETPSGTSATVAVRSGNIAEPDDTWSAWSAEQGSAMDAKAEAPIGRYLQYRVTLTSDNPKATPEFRQFALRYQTINQAPEIASLEVPDLDTKDLEKPEEAEAPLERQRSKRRRADLQSLLPQGRLEGLDPARRELRQEGSRMGYDRHPVGPVSAQAHRQRSQRQRPRGCPERRAHQHDGAGHAFAAERGRESRRLRERQRHHRSDRDRQIRSAHRGVIRRRWQALGQRLSNGRFVRQQDGDLPFQDRRPARRHSCAVAAGAQCRGQLWSPVTW